MFCRPFENVYNGLELEDYWGSVKSITIIILIFVAFRVENYTFYKSFQSFTYIFASDRDQKLKNVLRFVGT